MGDIRRMLDANVSPDTTLDGMKELLNRTPLDVLGEYYGIHKHQQNDLSKYLDKGITNPVHIQIIDNHFHNIGMPIPNGFLKYKELMYGESRTDTIEPGRVEENTSKSDDGQGVMEDNERTPTKPKRKTSK